MPLINVANLKKHYTSGDDVVEALRGVDITIEAGEFITIMGQSGSGKSTLLSVLGGMNHPTNGEVEMAGVKLYQLPGEKLADFRAQNLGFVFQAFNLIPYLTAVENVMLPLELRGDKTAKAAATALLHRVGLAQRLSHTPKQLSGGEQQRVALARAFVTRPAILFADEPTGNLDSKTGATIIELLFELNQENKTTLILVTHDHALAARCQRTLQLEAGCLV